VTFVAARLHDFDTVSVLFSAGKLNAFGGEFDLFFFVELSSRHFKCLFAHSEKGVDRFGVGLVVVRESPLVFLEEAKDFGGSIFHPGIAWAAGGHVNLCFAGRRLVGWQDIFYEPGELIANLDVAVDLVKVEDAGVAVVDDDNVADIGAAIDGEVNDIVVFHRQVAVAQEGLDLFGRGEAAGLFVEVDPYEVVAAQAHPGKLFGFGNKKVFHEAPVEKGAQWGQAHDAEQDDVSQNAFRRLGGGDDPVFAVVVEEDTEAVAGFGIAGGESFWKQDAIGAVVKDEADGELSQDWEGVVFADMDHRPKLCRFAG
jgi:hypothetical protein